MIYKDYRCLPRNLSRHRIQPHHRLTRHQRRHHPHVRTRIRTYKMHPIMFKVKNLITKYLNKSIAPTFTPLTIMITRQNVIRNIQPIHYAFCKPNLLIRTKFGDVARKNHKIQRILCHDIGNGKLQIFHISSHIRHMQVGQVCKPERLHIYPVAISRARNCKK
ncbi:hypothetical protein SDC9_92000 [bioreactor metagenome]|uniref:Uncharacterized protein n=1 Tax=bioreactor metagenome TaxID=1076179 RepID=A0A645A6C7_9ZZZZ